MYTNDGPSSLGVHPDQETYVRHMTQRHSSTPYIIGCMYLSKVEESMFFRSTTSRYSNNLVSKQIY